MNLEKENWQQASESFLSLYTTFPTSYLGIEALFKAAICFEELDNFEKAIEYYTELTEQYVTSLRVPHAYFSIARLNEEKEDYEEAGRIYSLLKLDFPYSNWTNLAINRIIELKSRGKISE